jgi:MSHA biogenesis protein MshE
MNTEIHKGADLPGIQIGQLLVEQGVLTDAQVQEILHAQKESHRPFGDLAERLFGVNPKAVEDAWVQQYVRETGLVDLEEVEFDADCLRLLNRRQAWQFHTLPTNREEGGLNFATSPENLIRAVNFSSRKIDEPVYFQIAERDQLREFLMRHYPVPNFIAQYAASM